MSKSSIKKIADVGILIIIGIIIIIGLFYHYSKDASVTKYKTETVGKIIGFKYRSNTNYNLKYKYVVNGVEYYGVITTGFFKCDDGTKGCVGEDIRVFYSSKEPKYSQVDLGKYEKHKTTINLAE